MNSTIEQIKSIISPVRVLKVEDFKRIGAILNPEAEAAFIGTIKYDLESGKEEWKKKDETMFSKEAEKAALDLISRYESLTSQPLVKEMFINAFEKPDFPENYVNENDAENDYVTYQAAQNKILFEGFEPALTSSKNWDRINIWFKNDYDEMQIAFWQESVHFESLRRYESEINACTVSDLIIEIDRYNRTASNPIQINFSDNFIQELIK